MDQLEIKSISCKCLVQSFQLKRIKVMMLMQKVIIDTDTGVDDAMAIFQESSFIFKHINVENDKIILIVHIFIKKCEMFNLLFYL